MIDKILTNDEAELIVNALSFYLQHQIAYLNENKRFLDTSLQSSFLELIDDSQKLLIDISIAYDFKYLFL